MPRLDVQQQGDSGLLLRVLAYGESGRKKTWWAVAAAEAGFNVLYLNGDKPATILKQIKPEAKGRVHIMEALHTYNYSQFIGALFNRRRLLWDDTAGKPVSAINQETQHEYMQADLSKLNNSWVLVVDSWTGLVSATMQQLADQKNVDLSEVDKIEWDLFGPSGIYLDWVLEQLKKLPCHVIVTGHEDTYTVYKKDAKGKQTPEILFSRTQPVSSSRPHGKKLAKNFTDVLRFVMLGTGNYIDTTSFGDRDGGSTNVPPKSYRWDELGFVDIAKSGGCYIPDGTQPQEVVTYYGPGNYPEVVAKAMPTQLNASAASGGLAGLLKMQPK